LLLVTVAHLVLAQPVVLLVGMVEPGGHLQLLPAEHHNLLPLQVVVAEVVDLQLVPVALVEVQKIR
jgi:hypothetical protein